MKSNPGKCHIILNSNTQREIRFGNTSIAPSLSEKLLGTTLDSELKFEEDINHIRDCKSKFDKLWEKVVLSVFIIEIFKRWLFKYLNF